ncbi:hypothetical protein ACOME3_008918 [Neoechinorhynchus agilis]
MVKASLEKILNTQLSDEAWRQASLPVSPGGLGIRKAADISLPAYLGSYVASRKIAQSFLGENYTLDEDLVDAITLWCGDSGSEQVPVNGCKRSIRGSLYNRIGCLAQRSSNRFCGNPFLRRDSKDCSVHETWGTDVHISSLS